MNKYQTFTCIMKESLCPMGAGLFDLQIQKDCVFFPVY